MRIAHAEEQGTPAPLSASLPPPPPSSSSSSSSTNTERDGFTDDGNKYEGYDDIEAEPEQKIDPQLALKDMLRREGDSMLRDYTGVWDWLMVQAGLRTRKVAETTSLLPPLERNQHGMFPITIVLELDGVMTSPQYTRKDGWRILMRPEIRLWLLRMHAMGAEIVVWSTFHDQEFADPIITELDQDGVIRHRIYSDKTSKPWFGKRFRDIRKLGRDPRKVVMLDVKKFGPERVRKNTLVVPAYKGDPDDHSFVRPMMFVELLWRNAEEDIRDAIERYEAQDPSRSVFELWPQETETARRLALFHAKLTQIATKQGDKSGIVEPPHYFHVFPERAKNPQAPLRILTFDPDLDRQRLLKGDFTEFFEERLPLHGEAHTEYLAALREMQSYQREGDSIEDMEIDESRFNSGVKEYDDEMRKQAKALHEHAKKVARHVRNREANTDVEAEDFLHVLTRGL